MGEGYMVRGRVWTRISTPHFSRTLVQLCNVAADEAVAFEDSPAGASAAVAAKVFTVGMLTTQPAAVLKNKGCGAVFDDYTPDELWELAGLADDR